MSARTWTEQSLEPQPWPAVVDEDGVTWKPIDEDGLGYLTYHQQKIVHLAAGGATAGTLAGDWQDLWACLPAGTTLREAVGDEADTWIETWAEAPS